MKNYLVLILIMAVVLFSCTTKKQPLEPDNMASQDFTISADSVSQTLTLNNQTSYTMYYAIHFITYLRMIEFTPCSSPETCGKGIQSGECLKLQYSELLEKHKEAKSIQVTYWFLWQGPKGNYDIAFLDSIPIDL